MRVRHCQGGGVMWWCPACECGHGGPGWNLVVESPETVHPSAIVDHDGKRCHSNISNGQIHWSGDSTNGWAGRSVPLEDF